jgi:hypothetical protein
MALIECDECGGVISTQALACPHCGAPEYDKASVIAPPQELMADTKQSTDPQLPDAKTGNQWLILVAAGFAVMVVIALLICSGSLWFVATSDQEPEKSAESAQSAQSAQSAPRHSPNTDATGGSAKSEATPKPKRTMEGTWIGPQSTRLTLKENRRFKLKANLCEGWGTVKGRWRESNGRLTLKVSSRDFRGFSGDSIQRMAFSIKRNTLIYHGESYGCAPLPGHTFSRR